MRQGSWLILMLIMGCYPGAEAVPWATMVAGMRAEHPHQGPYAVYLGSTDNCLPRLITSGSIKLSQVPIVFLAATDQVCNPWTNRSISGSRLQSLFGATAGTIIFLDEDGIPIPQLSIPQALHGNDPDLFTIYFRYVAAGHYRTMSISDYCRAIGQYQVLERALGRLSHGFAGRELSPGEPLVMGTNHVTGEKVDPWSQAGVFVIYSSSAQSRVFLAQIREICTFFGTLQPHLTLIVPSGEEPRLDDLPAGSQCLLAHASREAILAQGPSPLLVFTAHGDKTARGVRLIGFQPGSVLAKIIGIPVRDQGTGNRDIPYGEVDEDPEGRPGPAVAIDPAATAAQPLPPPTIPSDAGAIMSGAGQ